MDLLQHSVVFIKNNLTFLCAFAVFISIVILSSIIILDFLTFLFENAYLIVIVIAAFLVIKIIRKLTDFNFIRNQNLDKNTASLIKNLGVELASLSKHEQIIANQIINPSDIDVTFDDIVGLGQVIDEIRSNIILPLATYPLLGPTSRFLQPSKGVLLYGPPGCGKTMIAKATAKQANARFINLEVSKMTEKMYGETQKLASAVFTLADKLKPSIIFIDEIDSFLRSRDRNDHEATAMMKTEFMVKWEGLSSSKGNSGVVVIGATNRPDDVDSAIRRRMPVKLYIPLPNKDQRMAILEKFLAEEELVEVDLEVLAGATENFSSSDLKELCRNAVTRRIREKGKEIMTLTASEASGQNKAASINDLMAKLRPVDAMDFELALISMLEANNIQTID